MHSDPLSKGISAHARRQRSIRPELFAELKALLDAAGRQLHTVTKDDALMAESPIEVQDAIKSTAHRIRAALRRLESITFKHVVARSSYAAFAKCLYPRSSAFIRG